MSSREASNNPGLYPIKGQNLVLAPGLGPEINSRTCPWVLPDLATLPNAGYPPSFYLSSYILPRDPQWRLRSNKLLKRTISCEFVGDFVSSYPIVFILEAFKSLSLPPHSVHYYFRHPEKTCSCFYNTYSVREIRVLVFIAVENCFNFCLALSLEYVTGMSSIILFFLYLLHFLIYCQEYD